jgi:hypothetical protein
MKYLSILLILLSCSPTEKKYELPPDWNKDFSIKLYEGGGMRNQSKHVTFTYNKVELIETFPGDSAARKSFDLSDTGREEILKTLRSFNLGNITTREKPFETDQESVSLCFLTKENNDFCLESGSKTEFVDPGGSFGKAYSYLLGMAEKKGK